MAVELDRKAHIRANYDISALPFEHLEARNFTVHIKWRPEGKFVIQDMFGLFVTDEGKYDPYALVKTNADYFHAHCLMTEEQAFEVAQEYVENMVVNGFTAADIRRRDALADTGASQKEVLTLMRDMARKNTEEKAWEGTILTEEEFAKAVKEI